MTSAILIEKHQLDRQAISHVIENELNLQLVARAEEITEALFMSRQYCPAWLFVTAGDDPMGTVDTLMRIRCNCENTRIVILATDSFAPFVQRAFKTGVSACIAKSCQLGELKQAINKVRHGKRYMSREFAEYVINSNEKNNKPTFINRLTNRELQIMLMFVENMKVEQIALQLCLSPKTVSTYRYRIFDKLGVRGDVALMHLAHQHGLLNMRGIHHAA